MSLTYVGRSTTVQNLLFCSSVRRKQELCFVHGKRPLVNARKSKRIQQNLLGFKTILSTLLEPNNFILHQYKKYCIVFSQFTELR